MKLLRKLLTRKNKNGTLESWGVFWCDGCSQEVERQLSVGKRDKSCGCERFNKKHRQNLSNSHFGQKAWNKGLEWSEEIRIKIKKSKTGQKLTEEHKQNIKLANIGKSRNKGKISPNKGKTGVLAPNWQEGISFEIYPQEFNKELKQQILERDNYTCQDIDCEHKTNILDCHHIDYDKKNNLDENLITLCRSCHAKTFGKNNRQYYIEYYQNIQLLNEKN